MSKNVKIGQKSRYPLSSYTRRPWCLALTRWEVKKVKTPQKFRSEKRFWHFLTFFSVFLPCNFEYLLKNCKGRGVLIKKNKKSFNIAPQVDTELTRYKRSALLKRPFSHLLLSCLRLNPLKRTFFFWFWHFLTIYQCNNSIIALIYDLSPIFTTFYWCIFRGPIWALVLFRRNPVMVPYMLPVFAHLKTILI